MISEKYVGTEGLADMLKCSVIHIKKSRSKGTIFGRPFPKGELISGRWLYKVEDIEKWMKRCPVYNMVVKNATK